MSLVSYVDRKVAINLKCSRHTGSYSVYSNSHKHWRLRKDTGDSILGMKQCSESLQIIFDRTVLWIEAGGSAVTTVSGYGLND